MKKTVSAALMSFLLLFPAPFANASPWAENEGYFAKIGGKFAFGLKHALCSFVVPWTEANEPEYDRDWEGFCVGIGKILVYTATGIIQLATFPIPVDVPNIGLGIHMPDKHCPARHSGRTESPEEKSETAEETMDAVMTQTLEQFVLDESISEEDMEEMHDIVEETEPKEEMPSTMEYIK